MVERQLTEEGTSRQKLGREAFVERVWAWKRHYGGAILEQMKRLGVSVDLESRVTSPWTSALSVCRPGGLRPPLRAGPHFIAAHISSTGARRCQTAITILKWFTRSRRAHLWEIRYPVLRDAARNRAEFITVATTRPETMLGDTAVAIHPEDER